MLYPLPCPAPPRPPPTSLFSRSRHYSTAGFLCHEFSVEGHACPPLRSLFSLSLCSLGWCTGVFPSYICRMLPPPENPVVPSSSGWAVPSAGSAPFGEAFIAETIMVYFFQSSACEIGRETGILFPFLCVPKGDEVAISAFFAVYDSLA
eukprot:RCo023107